MTPLQFFHEAMRPVLASLAFIYVLLPAALLVWYLSPKKARPAVMLAASLGFYAFVSPGGLLLILASSLCDYFLTSAVCVTRRRLWRALALGSCVFKNLFLIAYFGFMTQRFSLVPPLGLLVTGVLGIDACLAAYREENPSPRRFITFMFYILFFPRLYTGPVCTYEHFKAELERSSLNPETISLGFERFTHGVFKYVVLSYGLYLLYESIAGIPAAQQTALSAWLLVFSFGFGVYFTLSGIADSSRGVCLMLGLTLPKSFYYPFQSHSVTDFFERFNMAAGAFIKRVIPRPLALRDTPSADILRILIAAALWGLWLGLRVNALLWGALVAAVMILEKYLYPKLIAWLPTLFRRFYALIMSLCGLAVFACMSPGQSLELLERMFTFSDELSALYNDRILYALLSNWILIVCCLPPATSLSSWLRGLFRAARPKLARVVFALADIAILAVTTVFLLGSGLSVSPPGLEGYLHEKLPLRDELLRAYEFIDVPGLGAPSRQTGFFVGEGYIMRNISPPAEAAVRANIEHVVEFAENIRQYRAQTYLMLVPGSGAILQQRLPDYASSVMVNQRQFISEVYGAVSGAAITIDAYSPLIQRQTQYIYYRTEDNLTALGGFYVYAAMLQRMALGEADFNQFGTEYRETDYFGNLADEAGRRGAEPDHIAIYPYGGTNRPPLEAVVRHTDSDGESKVYHTLFPAEAAALGGPMDIFLGGLSPVTDITSSRPLGARVLLFGDRTALSYAPFLAANCARVTIVDLSYPVQALAQINPADYDKIVFAYGADTFMHTNDPAKAVELLR
jgi:alginate O-acetyltransferase complex protein AlgI